MEKMSSLDWLATILTIIGAVNWGLIVLFNWNLVDAIFRTVPGLLKLIYILIGISGIYVLAKVSKKA